MPLVNPGTLAWLLCKGSCQEVLIHEVIPAVVRYKTFFMCKKCGKVQSIRNSELPNP